MTTTRNLFGRAIKTAFAISLILAVLGSVGCGKKNKVGTTAAATGTFNGIPSLPTQQGAQVQQLMTQFPCQNSQPRLADMNYSITSSTNNMNTSVLSGQFNPSPISGPVAAVYAGKSSFNDLIIVTKIANGSQVVGYNVTLSMCQYNPLLIPGRPLSNFQAPFGIVLDQDTNCGLGSVDSAQRTVMVAGQYQNYPQATVETTFYKPNCGGAL